MNDRLPPPAAPDPIDDQAAAWVLRLDRGLTPAEQDEFLQWRASDPRHNAALARQRRNWERLDLLAQWRPEHSPRPNPDLLAPAERPAAIFPRWARIATGLAAAAALVVFLAWPQPPPAPPENAPPAPIAAIESRTLPDGSVVELNRGAEIAVLFTPGERRVRLERGEAHFTVAKNPARPFIVSARGVDVCAVGTAFNVRLGHQAVEVLVTDGRVRVDQSTGAAGERATVVPALAQGHRTIVPLGESRPVQITSVSPEETEQILAWQPRILDFTAAPLRNVVAEFNRRNAPVHIVVADAELADIEVSASLRSDNVEGFVRLLEVGFSVQSERNGDTIRLRRH